MKKRKTLAVTAIILTLILISSSINAFNITSNNTQINKSNNNKILELVKQFSTPEIKENEIFLNLHVKETNSFFKKTGEPILPIYLKTYEFPLGTHIKDIKCIISVIKEIQINKEVTPAAKPAVYYNQKDVEEVEKNKEIYNSNRFYPENWFSYKLVGGLNRNNEHTTFLTVQINPVRYNPVLDTIQSINFIKLEITYEEPLKNLINNDEYDLLIITSKLYASLLTPLIDHKENHGIRTKLVTVKEIYNDAFIQGRDKPEKIKYFIKGAIENWNITYVMFVGDFRNVPIRYTHLETDAGGTYEELEFATDLYYSDIFDSEGNFSSWDTDNDGNYGEWPDGFVIQDKVDLSPDVYVGRLACMFKHEVKTMVEKIIDYEQNASGSEWFNTMIVCGGDTFDKRLEGGTDYDEGEVATEKALEYMTEFNPVKIYASLGNLTRKNIHNEICKGSGFLYFVGHGNPRKWGTHFNGDYINWSESYENKHMKKLSNDRMYPILIVGGCHNSEFDVAPINFIKGLLEEGLAFFSYNETKFGSYYLFKWALECWSWVFVKIKGGGCIASIGSVGYGGVGIGDENDNDIPDCIEGRDGWFETQFFRLYNEEEIDILGETYGQTVTDYVKNFPVFKDQYEAKIVETHVLLGDPSLKIGGYEK